jgi:tRNA(Ile2) C34 agmatinyltransferase TiaS
MKIPKCPMCHSTHISFGASLDVKTYSPLICRNCNYVDDESEFLETDEALERSLKAMRDYFPKVLKKK